MNLGRVKGFFYQNNFRFFFVLIRLRMFNHQIFFTSGSIDEDIVCFRIHFEQRYQIFMERHCILRLRIVMYDENISHQKLYDPAMNSS